MITYVKKWGNSLGIRLPKSMTKEILIDEGSGIYLKVVDGKIEISKIDMKENLDDILNHITAENQHSEINSNYMVGNEL